MHKFKYIIVLFTIMIFSCSSSKHIGSNIKYNIVNKIIDSYFSENKQKVYLNYYPIRPENHAVKGFFQSNNNSIFNYSGCNPEFKDWIFNTKEITNYKQQTFANKKWDYDKIKNSNIISELNLTRQSSITNYSNYKKSIKDKEDLLVRKYIFWQLETGKRMLKISEPYQTTDGNYAFCFISISQEGDFIYIVKKSKSSWNYVCRLRLNYH